MNIKLYDKDEIFKQTINPNIIKNDITFTKQINGWLWQLILILNVWLDNTDYIEWDIVKVLIDGSLIYTWFVDEIEKIVSWFEETRLNIIWYVSLLKRIIYNVTWNYTATITQDPYTTASDIVTYFNTKYNYLTISWSTTWTSVSYDLNYTDSFKAIDDLNNLSSNYFRYLDNETLYFKAKPTTPTHYFTLQKDLVELDIEEDWSWIVNQLILTYKTGTKTYTDATSVTTYWLKEKYISNTQIWDVTSADEFWNKYIADNKDPIDKITLEVNSSYANWIENINPWESCKIRNITKNIGNNLLISKITYNKDIIRIQLERFDNFIQLIKE